MEPGELGADLVGVGMMHIVHDGQSLLPRMAALFRFPAGLAGIAQVDRLNSTSATTTHPVHAGHGR